MCIGVTPKGVAGTTSPSMRSATAWPITFDAKVSVPVGRCGPCCSTLPAGRITSGFFLNCAAISGCVRSMKYRLGSTLDFVVTRHPSLNSGGPRLAADLGARLVEHVANAHALALAVDRPERRVDHGNGDVAIMRSQLVRLSARAALREHLELGSEHVAFGQRDRLALRPAVLATLYIERGRLVQEVRRIPGAEVDLVMHQALRAEYAHRKDAGGRPAGTDVAQFAVGESDRRHRLVVHFR